MISRYDLTEKSADAFSLLSMNYDNLSEEQVEIVNSDVNPATRCYCLRYKRVF
jgi:hypothetical protein